MMNAFAFVLAFANAKIEAAREEGATATEYALIVAGIAVVVFAAAGFFGDQLGSFFSGLWDSLGV